MNPTTPFPTPSAPAAIGHYENFPVASWLCPPALRAPVAAIYHFARTADDLADEGNCGAQTRLDDLAQYNADLQSIVRSQPDSGRWSWVFQPLARQMQARALPPALLQALLDAFRQDVIKTRDGAGYADRAELLDYCGRSANPVGRLLLHLYGIDDAVALRQSDAICSALQLINFWQDLSVDLPRGRYYLCASDCLAHGVSMDALRRLEFSPAVRALMVDLVGWARTLMASGSPLVHRLPGRIGWELRMVVQGGLRILDKIVAMDHDTLTSRPVIGRRDGIVMLARAIRM